MPRRPGRGLRISARRKRCCRRPDSSRDRPGAVACSAARPVAAWPPAGGRRRRRSGRAFRCCRRQARRVARRALSVHAPGRPDRPGNELGRVPSARAQVQRDHAGPDPDEGEHLGRLAADVVRAVGRAAIGAGHDLGDAFGRQVRGAGLSLRRTTAAPVFAWAPVPSASESARQRSGSRAAASMPGFGSKGSWVLRVRQFRSRDPAPRRRRCRSKGPR